MEGLLRRALRLGVVLATRPTEFVDRVTGIIDRLTDRPKRPLTVPLFPDAVWPLISTGVGADVSAILNEPTLTETDALLAEQMRSSQADGHLAVTNSAEPLLGHVAYVLCRALRPDTVVETGVAYGSMTTYILTALETNKRGMLHSIDLPFIVDRDARSVGRFVPQALRARWSLRLGASRRVLPQLLREIGPVGVFVHDSLHTTRNMAWEFATVTPDLASRAAVLSDDVESNRAFEDWAHKSATHWALVRQVERPGWLGVAFLSRPC